MADLKQTLLEFFSPLQMALEDIVFMEALLSDVGVEVDLSGLAQGAFDAVLPINSLLQALEEGIDDPDFSAADHVPALIGAIDGLYRLTGNQLAGLPGELAQVQTWRGIAEELPGYLLVTWLDDFYPVISALLVLGGAIEEIPRGPGLDPRRNIDWSALADLIANPPARIREEWGFGNQFDADGFLLALAALARAIGWRPRLIPVATQLQTLLATRQAPQSQLVLRTELLRTVSANASTYATAALDLVGASAQGSAQATTGLALVPSLSGNTTQPVHMGEALAGTLAMTGAVTGGAGLAVYPSSVEILGGASTQLRVTIDLAGRPDDGWLLFGDKHGSCLVLSQAAIGIALDTATRDISVAIDLADALVLKIAASDGDGLFSTVLGETEFLVQGGIAATWSLQAGWSLAGGLGLDTQVTIGREVGPFAIDSIRFAIAASGGGLSGLATVSGSLELGPLFLGFEDIGLDFAVGPADPGTSGLLGSADASLGFHPPAGFAVGLDLDPIRGGGFFAQDGNGYRGALALQFEKFGLSAFAILDTELPGGRPGFSLAASVFGEFSLPLAYGFFLTGVGGVLGINRTVNTDALRDALYAGSMDNLLFPVDPIGSAQQILTDMAAILPERAGQHFIGPVARISWGKPTLINVTLGVIIEVGDEARLVILGGLSMILPDEDRTLVEINLNFFGEIDFAAGTISFDASLEGSRVLTYTITGDTAIRTGWASGIDHVASFGGLHPKYPKPDNLPDLRRLSISFGGNNPRVTFSAYQAITSNSLQFGARADLYARGPDIKLVGQVAAEGYIAFDALIYFNPFEFFVDLEGGLSILVNGKVKAGLFFALSLRGPNSFTIDGQVWVKVCGVKVEFAITHTWGRREAIANATASAVEQLRLALENGGGFEPVTATTSSGVAFRTAQEVAALIDPLGTLRLVQSAVPLDVAIEKLGEADIIGPARLDLQVSLAGQQAAIADASGEFVRGHFFTITKAERLRAPSFETHKAGFSFTAEGFASAGAECIGEYEWEVITIDVATPASAGGRSKELMSAGLIDRSRVAWQDSTVRDPRASLAQVVKGAPGKVTLGKVDYFSALELPEVAGPTHIPPISRRPSQATGATHRRGNFSRLRATGDAHAETNAVVAAYLRRGKT